MMETLRAEDKLKQYIDVIRKKDHEHTYDVVAYGGRIIAQGLVNTSIRSISETIFDNKNMSSDWHQHKQTEHCILMDGVPYIIEIKGYGKFTVTCSKSIYVPPNTPHRLLCTQGYSKSLIILVPGSTEFPKGVYGD